MDEITDGHDAACGRAVDGDPEGMFDGQRQTDPFQRIDAEIELGIGVEGEAAIAVAIFQQSP